MAIVPAKLTALLEKLSSQLNLQPELFDSLLKKFKMDFRLSDEEAENLKTLVEERLEELQQLNDKKKDQLALLKKIEQVSKDKFGLLRKEVDDFLTRINKN